MEIVKELWGQYEGQDIYRCTLRGRDMEVAISNFGAVISGIYLPGRAGNKDNIVLGYDTLQEYVADTWYTGSLVGRFAGRIVGAALSIDGVSYALAQNEAEGIHLHGGIKGFGKQAFRIVGESSSATMVSVELHYRSPHLEEGYPGNLDLWVTYSLSVENCFSMQYRAVTDRDTHINLTNHSYFNLCGPSQDITGHRLLIDANSYLVSNGGHLPTGEIAPVEGTPYSFRRLRLMSEALQAHHAGYNDCYVLNRYPQAANAVLSDAQTGRTMILKTDLPALLLYTGDYLGGKFIKNNGLCLEAQFFPDAPNHPAFPCTLLRAGEEWRHCTKLYFRWNDA